MQLLHLGAHVGDAVDEAKVQGLRAGPEGAGEQFFVGCFELARAAFLDDADEDVVDVALQWPSGAPRPRPFQAGTDRACSLLRPAV